MQHRRTHRHDANQYRIEQDLLRLGFSVADTSLTRTPGFPDLVIGRAGIDAKVEVKLDTQVSSSQNAFAEAWRGSRVIVAHRTIDVLTAFDELLQRMRRY